MQVKLAAGQMEVAVVTTQLRGSGRYRLDASGVNTRPAGLVDIDGDPHLFPDSGSARLLTAAAAQVMRRAAPQPRVSGRSFWMRSRRSQASKSRTSECA